MGLDDKQLNLEVELELTWEELHQRVMDGRADPSVLEKAVKFTDQVHKALKEGKTFIIYPNGVWVSKG